MPTNTVNVNTNISSDRYSLWLKWKEKFITNDSGMFQNNVEKWLGYSPRTLRDVIEQGIEIHDEVWDIQQVEGDVRWQSAEHTKEGD